MLRSKFYLSAGFTLLRSCLYTPLFLLLGVPSALAVLPSFEQVRAEYRSSEGKLLGSRGEVLQEQRLSFSARALAWVPIEQISPALREAVMFVEDRRFYEHAGVDYLAVLGAAYQNLTSDSTRGASTITMQVVKLLEPRHRRRLTFWEKTRQARMALELEKSWTKPQIFEAYLNLVSFRGEHQGVMAAARAFFGKEPHGLSQRESFVLALLLRSPGAKKENLAQRLCEYSRLRPDLGSCDDLRVFATEALARPIPRLSRHELAPHLARRLLADGHANTVRTYIDSDLQHFVLESIEEQLERVQDQNVQDAAVIVVENQTGRVIAYVGSSGTRSKSPHVDMAISHRQAGSTLKPFLYALAIEKKYLQPNSWILDEPYEITLERGAYRPDNYDHVFRGPVSLKVALAASLNIPAVRTVELIGVDNFHASLEALGFTQLEEPAFYGPALALGTADVMLVDLVNAYRTLANDGVWSPLKYSEAVQPFTHSRRVFSPATTHKISSILSDRSLRATTFGFDSSLATAFAAAVKTGTSKDMRDNWCIGYSREFTVGVWVGNSGGDPMWQVSGVTGAAPIWREVMDHVHKNRVKKEFTALKEEDVPDFYRPRLAKIRYPQDGMLVALDPDIPDEAERIPLESDGNGFFQVDGVALVSDLWQPSKGKHTISLHSSDGLLLDEVKVTVR